MADIVTDYGVNYNWKAYKNGQNTFTITFTSGGSAFDLSDYTFTLNIRTPGGSENKLQLTEGSGLTNGGATGILTVSLTQTQASTTLPRADYYYELTFVKDSLTYRVIQGNLTLSSETNPASVSSSLSVSISLAGTAVTAAVTLAGTVGDDELTAIANLSPSNGDFIYRENDLWVKKTTAETAALLNAVAGDPAFVTVLTVFEGTAAVLELTNQANTEQNLNNSGRSTRYFDATGYNYIQVAIQLSNASTSSNTPRLYASYSLDNVTYVMIGSGTGSEIISLATPTGHKVTDWIALPAAAKDLVYFRISQNGGDGAADPTLGYAEIRFKK